MPFPTTSILDQFNRANANPLSGNWTTIDSHTALQIVSQQVKATVDGSLNVSYYNTGTYGPNSESYIDVPTIDRTSDYSSEYLYVRLQSPDTGVYDGYHAEFAWRSAASTVNNIIFNRIDNSSYTQLGATITGETFANDDSYGLEIIGSTLKAYKKPSAGSWSERGSRTDGTYTGTGYIGFGWAFNDSTVCIMDNFGGGTVVAGSSYDDIFSLSKQLGLSSQSFSGSAYQVSFDLSKSLSVFNGDLFNRGIVFIGQDSASTTGATSLTINKPTGTVENHVMVASLFIEASAPNVSSPGWGVLQRDQIGTRTAFLATFFKVANANEPSSYTFYFSGSYEASGGIASWWGTDPNNPTGSTTTREDNVGSVYCIANGLTTRRNDAVVIYTGGTMRGTTMTPPGNYTEIFDIQSGGGTNNVSLAMAYRTYTTSGTSTGNITGTFAASDFNVAQLIELRPGMSHSFSLPKQLSSNFAAGLSLSAILELGKSLGISMVGSLTINEAVALAKILAISSSSTLAGNTYESSLSLGKNLNITVSELLSLQETINLARSANISFTGLLDIPATLSLAKSLSVLVNSTVTISETISLAKSVALYTLGGLSISESIALAKQLNIAVLATLTVNEAVSLGKMLGLSEQAVLDLLGIFSLSSIKNISTSAIATIPETLNLTKSLALVANGGLSVAESFSLAKQLQVSLSSAFDFNVTVSLGKALGLSEQAVTNLVASLSLNTSKSITISSTMAIQGAINLAKALNISISPGMAAYETLPLGKYLSVLSVAGGTVADTISLGKSLSCSTSASFLLALSLTLGKILSVSDTNTIDMQAAVGLNRVSRLTDGALLSLYEQLSLNKSVSLSPSIQISFSPDISLGRVLTVTVSAGQDYSDALSLNIIKAISTASQLVQFVGQLPAKLILGDTTVWLISVQDKLSPDGSDIITVTDVEQSDFTIKDVDHV